VLAKGLTCLQNAPKLYRRFDQIRRRGAVLGVDELGSRRSPAAAVRFGEFRLDPVRAEFTRSGQPVALRPKTYALLNLFAASPGRVLGKDELLAALWPNTVVAEGSLSQCVTELRAALGDLGDDLIKTVPRQGYRFDAEVRPDPEPAALAAQDKPSIAVLPFQNISGDPEQEYFADGLVQEIITALSRQRSLFVIARNSSFVYKGKAVNVKQVGRELGVRYVLEGSVRKDGDRVRIAGQLVDASTGAQIWGDRFEGGLEDIFDLQDQITASVVVAIWRKLENAEIERAKHKPTGSLHAYDYYLRGMAVYYQMYRREQSGEALGLFEKAIELDPEFAAAYAAAANCYAVRKASSWMVDTASEALETERLARRGIELARDDAFVRGACGFALAFVVGDLDAGAALLDSALALNPNLADAWLWGGWIKIWFGEPDAAVARFDRAVRLSPIGLRTFGLRYAMAHAHFFAGRYDEASSWAAMAMGNRPDVQPVLRIEAASNALAGRLAQAGKSVARLRELYPNLRLCNLRTVIGPYRRAEDIARYEEGLRRAGLPE
jgi:TolB-like protein/Tfp pilus assembly protein PilF